MRARSARFSRRGVLRIMAAAPVPLLLAACGGSPATATPVPPPTPPVLPPTAAASSPPAAPTPRPFEPSVTPAPSQPPSATAVAATPTSPPVAATQPAAATRPAATSQTLAPTPACGDADHPTVAQTAGPYFTPNSPERNSLLEPGMSGTRLVLTGRVISTACQPVARALIDFWQADDKGVYDNAGYRLRGHQMSDAQGRYRLETLMPGLYPGRTRHIHVNVQAPNRPILTTQLYFPDEPANARDGIFHRDLVMTLRDAPGGGKDGSFDFVLRLS